MKLGGKKGVLSKRKGHNRLIGKTESHMEVKEQKSRWDLDGTG